MRRGRRYDVPTIIERNAIEERSFRIQLSYKTHDDEQRLFDPRDEQRYTVPLLKKSNLTRRSTCDVICIVNILYTSHGKSIP